MIKIGCAGYPVRQSLYQQHLQFVEVGERSGRKPRETTLKKWRESAPKEFEFVIRAPQLWIDPVRASGIRWNGVKGNNKMARAGTADTEIRRLMEQLDARVVVFELPTHFHATPDRVARFQALVRSVPQKDLSVVWHPPKGWPETLVDRLSQTLRIIPAANPLRAETRARTIFRYLRIKAAPGTRITDLELKTIHKACGGGLAYVVFDLGPTSFAEAMRFSMFIKGKS